MMRRGLRRCAQRSLLLLSLASNATLASDHASALHGLRLFYDSDQRRAHHDREAPSAPPAVVEPIESPRSPSPADSVAPERSGHAVVQGSGGVHRIAGGVPLPPNHR